MYKRQTDKSGNITLLDSNKNGKYDIVFVKNYENIVVDSVSSTGKIVDKYSQKVLKLDDCLLYTSPYKCKKCHQNRCNNGNKYTEHSTF